MQLRISTASSTEASTGYEVAIDTDSSPTEVVNEFYAVTTKDTKGSAEDIFGLHEDILEKCEASYSSQPQWGPNASSIRFKHSHHPPEPIHLIIDFK